MTELAFNDPCILFALRREAHFFLQEFRPQQKFAGAPCRARFCGPAWLTVLVAETGIGPSATRATLDWLLNKPLLGNVPYEPRVVLSAGFAGALQNERRVGDVILATEVVDSSGKVWPTTWPGELPPGEWRPPLHRGRLLSADHLLLPPEKRRLGEQSAALAVDMESSAVAERCVRQGLPFGCVRVICEDVNTALSGELVTLFSGSRISWLRVVAALARKPGLLPEFMALWQGTKCAAQNLAKAIGELLTLTLPFGAEL